MDVRAAMDGGKKGAAAWFVVLVAGGAAIAWSLGIGAAAGQEAGKGLVERLRSNGAELRSLGRKGTLEGWLVRQVGGESYTLYVDGTGHAVMGVLFDPEGASVTREQLGAVPRADVSAASPDARVVRMRPASAGARSGVADEAARIGLAADRAEPAVASATADRQPAPAAGILEAALAVDGFDLGEAGPQVAVFADPTCFPSRLAVARLAGLALAGALRLRVVPVGVRGGDAEAFAGAVIDSPDRALAWFEVDREGSGPATSQEGLAGAAMNRSLFDRTGSEFVPFVLMREAGGGVASAVGLDFEAWFEEGPGK